MRYARLAALLVVLLLLVLATWGLVEWTVNRVYVPEGHSLMLRYKGPLLFGGRRYARPGAFADEKAGEIGIFEQLRGPGRHFYCPIWYERTVVPDIVVRPQQIGVVTSKLGESLPGEAFLVDGEIGQTHHKGVLRKAYGPGRYRVNPYAYEFKIVETQVEHVGLQEKHSGWVEVPTGYVGVVTYLTENPGTGKRAGIQDQVLAPGIYPTNPREQQIDIVGIGYQESSIKVVEMKDSNGELLTDESGEPVPTPETGINFPSNDGYEIQIDFTAVWGVMPEQAPNIIRRFGNVEAVEQKVILPQSESICRNNGSKLGAVDLLVGESRQEFQDQTSLEFDKVLDEKGITLLNGLVRHIYIPRQVRVPIQQSFIADELKLTRDQETSTAKTEALLREAEQEVVLQEETTRVESEKMVAQAKALGESEAKAIEAETAQRVAAIEKEIAELNAKKQVVLGEAESQSEQLQQEARADKFKLAVEAFGTGAAYTQWQFAEGLPADMDLRMLYAGEGTLWTDLDGVRPVLPIRAEQKPKAREQEAR